MNLPSKETRFPHCPACGQPYHKGWKGRQTFVAFLDGAKGWFYQKSTVEMLCPETDQFVTGTLTKTGYKSKPAEVEIKLELKVDEMKKDSPLTWTIESILAEARADQSPIDGKSPRKWGRVSGGLEIHIQFTGKNEFKLGLARADVHPSLQEWETVIEYWPEDHTHVTIKPHETEDKDHIRKWLVGTLTIVQ